MDIEDDDAKLLAELLDPKNPNRETVMNLLDGMETHGSTLSDLPELSEEFTFGNESFKELVQAIIAWAKRIGQALFGEHGQLKSMSLYTNYRIDQLKLNIKSSLSGKRGNITMTSHVPQLSLNFEQPSSYTEALNNLRNTVDIAKTYNAFVRESTKVLNRISALLAAAQPGTLREDLDKIVAELALIDPAVFSESLRKAYDTSVRHNGREVKASYQLIGNRRMLFTVRDYTSYRLTLASQSKLELALSTINPKPIPNSFEIVAPDRSTLLRGAEEMMFHGKFVSDALAEYSSRIAAVDRLKRSMSSMYDRVSRSVDGQKYENELNSLNAAIMAASRISSQAQTPILRLVLRGMAGMVALSEAAI